MLAPAKWTRSQPLFSIEIENFDQLVERFGQAAADRVVQRLVNGCNRCCATMTTLAQIGDARFAICLTPYDILDLELCIQMAGRMQSAIEEADFRGRHAYLRVSLRRILPTQPPPGKTGAEWLQAAATALREAHAHGPSAIRAFSDQMRRDTEARRELREEVAQRWNSGQIQPWFQPQISTDTGQITGFEALARWITSRHAACCRPPYFLPAIEQAGLAGTLGRSDDVSFICSAQSMGCGRR